MFYGESEVYSKDVLFVCRRSSVICDVSRIKRGGRVAVPAISTVDTSKAMEVRVAADSTLEGTT